MAKRKNLKKDIDYLCGELKLEALFQPKTDGAKYFELSARIDKLNDEFRSRIQRPAGKEKQLVKQYYKQLREDFDAETEKIYAELKSLTPEKSEN
jgi:hemerythrin superfamily protein